jgi:hypothetical protein
MRRRERTLDERGQGRKRKTSKREDHFLSLQARRKRFVTAQHLRNDLLHGLLFPAELF